MTTPGAATATRKRKSMTGAGRGVGAFFDEERTSTRVDEAVQTSQHTDIQAITGGGLDEDALERATFYIRPGQQSLLEELKLRLRRRNVKTNKSELIREAIDLLSEQELAALEQRIATRYG